MIDFKIYQFNNIVKIQIDGKISKSISLSEFKNDKAIDEFINSFISEHCFSSHGKDLIEHSAKRLYIKIQLQKILNQSND